MKKNYIVLCIDDDINILRSLKRFIPESSFKVITEPDPFQGLEILKTEFVDIIITDYQMPEMDGITFLKQAKMYAPSAIRIMLTGYSDIDVTIAAINDGEIHKYITKPWDNKVFLGILTEALESKKNSVKDLQISSKELEMEIYNIREVLKSTNFNTIKALSKTIELNDTYTQGHCERVVDYSLCLGKKTGLNMQQLENLKYAATLHDIGKIGVPSQILNKPGLLTPEEREVIEHHPVNGAYITSVIDFLDVTSRIILEHHERIDGHGYPGKKTGKEILLESKILSIGDVYDALVSDRAYRPAIPVTKVRVILMEEKGKMFDPVLVDKFIEYII